MSEELLINVSPMESRVAVLSNGVLSEIYIERHNKMGLVGNIYLGTVVRVLPGMQAAFVDVGESRTAFLHVNDMQKPQSARHDDSVSLLSNADSKTTSLDNTTNKADNTDTALTSPISDNLEQSSEPNTYTLHNTQTLEANNNPTNNPPIEKASKNNASINSFSIKQDPTNISLFATDNNSNSNFLAPSPYTLKNNQEKLNNTNSLSANNPPNTTETNQTQHTDKDSLNPVNELNVVETTEKPIPTTFRVLPTVTEILTRDNLTPNESEGMPAVNNLHSNFEKPPADAFTTSKAKRQANVNPHNLIQNRLREGQRVLVQVTKDQLGTKGARLTTNISLPSRYLVYLPSSDNIGISQRIDNIEERDRLRTELTSIMQKVNFQGGLIARTAAEKIPTQKLEDDIYYLLQLWRTIQARQKDIHPHQKSMPVYHELSLPLRSLRDLVHEETERVVVDDAQMYDYLRNFANEFVPMIYPRIVPYHSQQPMFDVYRVEEDLRDALKRRVDLKSGGYLIIDQTEAMTTIDVNTGSFVGGRSLEDTVYKTNLEATHAIASQLRLRNLGGIIILDFIDMQEQEHRDDVLISLQTQLAEDYARTNITQVSELGLVEMTRKRTRESLEQQLCEPCPTCQGKGFVKTSETVCFEIYREIMRCARAYNAPKQFTVVAHASVIDILLTSEADTVADLEYLLGRVITFEVENLYTQEQYDIVLD